jgi:Mn2+/Fe2+ NRAMP family transporter
VASVLYYVFRVYVVIKLHKNLPIKKYVKYKSLGRPKIAISQLARVLSLYGYNECKGMYMKVLKKIRNFFRILGPGLVTGAADDDPSGIATYSQTGAQFGLGQLWVVLYVLPFMVAIQEACARVGAVTGKGLAGALRDNYSATLVRVLVGLVLIANTINIGADIGAMAAALHLVLPVSFIILILLLTATMLFLEIFVTYQKYSQILKWLSLSLLVYPLTMLIVAEPWGALLKASIIPQITWNFDYFFIITAVFGTTISPYMFFWEASQVVEEEREKGLIDAQGHVHITPKFMRNLRIDNFCGMFFSQIATWSIIVVAATVLHQHGITDVKTSADAAKALEPLVQSFPHAGYLSEVLFAIGIVGLGALAVPVLAASVAYPMSEVFGWKSGLALKLNDAFGFYGVITMATLVGLCINFIGIDPIKALVYTAVINGIVAVPLIFFIALTANSKKIMGKYKSGIWSNSLVWGTFIIMAASALGMIFT